MITKKELQERIKELEKINFKFSSAYNILMDYWDLLPNEEKADIDKRLKKLGL